MFGVKSQADKLASLSSAETACTDAFVAKNEAEKAYWRELDRVKGLTPTERNDANVIDYLKSLSEALKKAEATYSHAIDASLKARRALGIQ